MKATKGHWTKTIEGCKRNERLHQEALYRGLFPKMLPMVKRHTQDQDEIVSIMNDGFLRVFKKIDQFSGTGSFEGWVRKLIYHSVSNYFRARKVKVRFLFDELEDMPYDQENTLEYEDLLEMVKELPEKEKLVFQMHAIYGYSHPEISEQTQINQNTSRWLLSNARKQLQEKLQKSNLIDRHA